MGVHLSLLPGSSAVAEPTPGELAALSPEERERALLSWRRGVEWRREEAGYAELQGTRPQTLAYALTEHSPVGQLAWIAEKFRAWTDAKDRPEEAVDRDLMLTNVMLYWLTATAGSSARIVHHERAHADYWGTAPEPSTAPTALAVSSWHEPLVPLRHIAERTNNIVRWTEFDRGGHFAAAEEPELLVEDVRSFFRDLRADA